MIDFIEYMLSLPPAGEKFLIGDQHTNREGKMVITPTTAVSSDAAIYGNAGSFILDRANVNGYMPASAKNIEHCLCMMLDDIGSKSKVPTIEPTWKIETSPGNFQWGYVFSERPTKADYVAAYKAIADAGYSDPGADNPVRWFRLPGSVNLKPGRDRFKSVLVEFHPERTTTLPALCDALGVVPGPIKADPAYLTSTDDTADDVLVWLSDNGHLINPRPSNGWYSVKCPAAHEHTDGNAAGFYKPSERAFKCHHSHGDHWKSPAFLAWVAEEGGPQCKPGIRPELLFAAMNNPQTPDQQKLAEAMAAAGAFMQAEFAKHGLIADDYRHLAHAVSGNVPAYAIKFSDGHSRIYYANGETRNSAGVSPAPATFGSFKGCKLSFTTDSWMSAAALHRSFGLPVICVEEWAFGEITSEDGESGRALHTGILAAIADAPGMENRIITTAGIKDDADRRKRLATFRVLMLDEGVQVKAFTLPATIGPDIITGFGQWCAARYGDRRPTETVLMSDMFKGKDAGMARIPDEELADAAQTYTMSNVEMYGKFHLDLTDRGAGSYILSKLGRGTFYYIEETGKWVEWRKGEWHDIGKDPLHLVNVAALGYKQRALVLYALAEEIGIRDGKEDPAYKAKLAEAKSFHKRSDQLSGTTGRGLVLKDMKARPDVAISTSIFDADPYLLGVINGVVDLRTGELRDVTKADMMLRRCPVRYAPGARHPKMEKFLQEITSLDFVPALGGFMHAPDRMAWLQRRLGAALIGVNALTSLEILHGRGSNGKSVIAKFLEAALGRTDAGGYAASIPAGVIMSTFHKRDPEAATPTLAKIVGARVVVMSETADTDRLNEQMIKTITGGDTVQVRGLYKDAAGSRPTYTPFLLTNPLPGIPEGGKATWDRIAPFHFKCRWRRVGNTDAGEAHLPPEDRWYIDDGITDPAALEFFLSWLITGCVEFKQSGLGDVPTDVIETISQYKEQTDLEMMWMQDEGWSFKAGERTPVNVLFYSYQQWCQRNGKQAPAANIFSQRLVAKFDALSPGRDMNSRYINGIHRQDVSPDFHGFQHS